MNKRDTLEVLNFLSAYCIECSSPDDIERLETRIPLCLISDILSNDWVDDFLLLLKSLSDSPLNSVDRSIHPNLYFVTEPGSNPIELYKSCISVVLLLRDRNYMLASITLYKGGYDDIIFGLITFLVGYLGDIISQH